MLQAIRRLLILISLLFPIIVQGQGFTLQNFSAFTSGHTLVSGDTATINNSWYGTGATGGATINNSSGALTIQTTWACADGAPPNHSGKILDYDTTIGNGINNQELELNWPLSGTSTVSMGAFWFCSTIPVTVSFGTTFDAFFIPGNAGGLSNYTSNGTKQCWDIEGNSSQTCIPYTSGTTVLVNWQYVTGGTCVDAVGHTDCLRLRLYDRNLNLSGEQFVAPAGANAPTFETFGNINPISATGYSGHHVQFSDIWTCFIGCTASEFPVFQNLKQPWQGLITPGRAIDWTQTGFPGYTLPDAAWTQCSTTLAAGTYAGSTITASMAGCAANTYYLLGPGTFNVSGQIKYPTSGHVVLRGSGANTTFLVHTGTGATVCDQASTFICMQSSDHTFTTQPPPIIYNWTAGYPQASNQITLSSVTGITLNNVTSPSLIFLDQCDTGYTGAPCSGTATDNGQLYICGDAFNATGPHGCSSSGPDAGGMRPERDQLEIHTATAINGSVVTITPPLIMPNWVSGQTPQAWIVTSISNVGLENLSIDASAVGSPSQCVETQNAYQIWVSGVKFVNCIRDSINLVQTTNSVIKDNYIYKCTGTPPSCYGIRHTASANNLIQNNIIQQVAEPIIKDGAGTGDVRGYNYIISNQDTSNTLDPGIFDHSGNYFNLDEGNAVAQISCDNIHGTCGMDTRFRNFLPGWESVPSAPLATFTNSIGDFAFSRYSNDIGGVNGTLGYHTGCYSATGTNNCIYWLGKGPGSVPVDPLTASTSLRYANYDTVTGANRYCGNARNTNFSSAGNCNSVSEASAGASTFPGFVPIIGDTTAGQPSLPASFYLTSTPTWFGSIPFPAIGPDIASGNVGQCTGTINTIGQTAKVAAISAGQCPGTGITTGWAGHVNAIPAMACALNTMGMPSDGSGPVLAFDAGVCYGGTPPAPIATFTPNPLVIGQVPVGLTSNPSVTVTLTNTGTANLIVTSVSPGAIYTLVNNTCGTSFTLTPGQSCTFQVTVTPVSPVLFSGGITFSDNAGNPDILPVVGIGTGPPAPNITQFAKRIHLGYNPAGRK